MLHQQHSYSTDNSHLATVANDDTDVAMDASSVATVAVHGFMHGYQTGGGCGGVGSGGYHGGVTSPTTSSSSSAAALLASNDITSMMQQLYDVTSLATLHVIVTADVRVWLAR